MLQVEQFSLFAPLIDSRGELIHLKTIQVYISQHKIVLLFVRELAPERDYE